MVIHKTAQHKQERWDGGPNYRLTGLNQPNRDDAYRNRHKRLGQMVNHRQYNIATEIAHVDVLSEESKESDREWGGQPTVQQVISTAPDHHVSRQAKFHLLSVTRGMHKSNR